jgi:hypothetical protein
MNHLSLSSISYPVFRLGLNAPTIENGVSFYFSEKGLEEGGTVVQVRIIDDKNLPQTTLSLRRLQLALSDAPLFKIKQAIFFLGDLIKLATPKTWFIDSNGKLFTYTKTSRAKLKFHRIDKLIPINTGGVIVELDGIPSRFKSLYSPDASYTTPYAGVLHFGMSLVLYGFYDQKYEDTWRTV